MSVEFDPDKDEINIAKHGISLARAGEIEILAALRDDRHDYGEVRFRAWGLIDNEYFCLAFAVRGQSVRAISLRRAHKKEIARHVP